MYRHFSSARFDCEFLSTLAILFDTVKLTLLSILLQDWSSYLRYGDNSWRRLGDPIGRREIALLLTIHLSKYDSSFSQVSHLCSHFLLLLIIDTTLTFQIYQDEFLDIWFQTIVYPKLVNQSSLTSILLNIATPSILFSEIPFVRSLESNKFEISLEELKAGRNDLLRCKF